jgi:hypothetical protein
MLRPALGVAAGGGVLSTLLTTGWAGAALLIAVVLVLVGAVCWVVNDPQRPDRLALLIATWRGRTPDGLALSGEPGAAPCDEQCGPG